MLADARSDRIISVRNVRRAPVSSVSTSAASRSSSARALHQSGKSLGETSDLPIKIGTKSS